MDLSDLKFILGHNAVLLAGLASRQKDGCEGGERDGQPTDAHHASAAQQLRRIDQVSDISLALYVELLKDIAAIFP